MGDARLKSLSEGIQQARTRRAWSVLTTHPVVRCRTTQALAITQPLTQAAITPHLTYTIPTTARHTITMVITHLHIMVVGFTSAAPVLASAGAVGKQLI